MNIAQNICLAVWSSLKLSYLASETRILGQIKGKPCQQSGGHSFKVIIMNLAQNVCLDDF